MLFTGLYTTMVSISAPKALAISLDLVIANDTESITAAAARYATAFSDVFDSKKPTTATSPLAMNSLAASTSVSSTARGPEFFTTKPTISLAVRPPEKEDNNKKSECGNRRC